MASIKLFLNIPFVHGMTANFVEQGHISQRVSELIIEVS